MGMPEPTDTDFGETLYVWGVPEGGYLELPVLGPATERSTWGKVVDLVYQPAELRIGLARELPPGPSLRYRRNSATAGGMPTPSIRSCTKAPTVIAQARSLYLQNRRFELGGDSAGGGAYLDPYDDPYSDPYEDPYDE